MLESVARHPGLTVPDLDPLMAELRRTTKLLGEQLGRRGIGVGAPEAATAGGNEEVSPGGQPVQQQEQPIQGAIHSRNDVIAMLDKVIEYYRQREPASPVPMLIERAKGLGHKDFLEIIRDLAPDGVAQVEKLRGAEG
jgi:type VI secretion system protein ImpA